MRINYRLLFFLLSVIICFSSCVTRSYYLSPLYGVSTSYKTTPLAKDTVKSNLYLNGAFNIGGNNENLRDNSFSFHGNIYNAHKFGAFRAWYGAGLTLGNYEVKKYDSSTTNPDFDTAYINKKAGNKFFGSANLGAGISIAIPVGNFCEWRIIGINGSLQNEFGKYLQFRQNMERNDIHITGLNSNSTLATAGIFSELSFITRTGSFNLQLQYNYLIGGSYTYLDYNSEGQQDIERRYAYVSNTFALTVHRFTGFAQVNAGKRMANLGLGMNYQLAGRKAKHSNNPPSNPRIFF